MEEIKTSKNTKADKLLEKLQEEEGEWASEREDDSFCLPPSANYVDVPLRMQHVDQRYYFGVGSFVT